MDKEDFKNGNFDKPAYIWVVEYFDRSQDYGDTSDTSNEMVVFEYHERPLTEEEVREEVRRSFTGFSSDKALTLSEIGIEIVSLKKEEC